MSYEACVIGCGQIGTEVMKALTSQYFTKDQIIGTDINSDTIERLEAEGFHMTNAMCLPEAKAYFVCVWNTSDVKDILLKLDHVPGNPVIFIETTIDPSEMEDLLHLIHTSLLYEKVIFFPHRFNPNDPEHHIFNQKRLFAPMSLQAEHYGMDFLRKVMNPHLIHWATPKIAIVAKVVENTYRALEIILAQEISKACIEEGSINFDNLREAVNSKWNINIKEARDGVLGKCLPKDLALYNKYFKTNHLSNIMEMLNNDYIRNHKS